jgi:pyruvate carboxylase
LDFNRLVGFRCVKIVRGLVVIEAIKLEHPILAPEDGVISGVRARVGQMVTAGYTLLTFDPTGVVIDDLEVGSGVP